MSDRDFNKDGQTYFELKEYKKAIECFDKAIEINPEDEVAWFNSGFAYFKLKDYTNSTNSFKKAISIFDSINSFFFFLFNFFLLHFHHFFPFFFLL